MGRRNNQDRAKTRHHQSAAEVPPPQSSEDLGSALKFVAPTEFVELPSKGVGYPEGHPLFGKQDIEISFMTARHEDILTSQSLLKKGMAFDRLIQTLLVDSSIDPDSLLSGDRAAILIAARRSAYGPSYNTVITCPSCGEQKKKSFDLHSNLSTYHGDDWEGYNIQRSENGELIVILPSSRVRVGIQLMNGASENRLLKKQFNKNKKQNSENVITDMMRLFVKSVNGDYNPQTIEFLINNVMVSEARYLRKAFAAASPDIKIMDDFECSSCGYEQEMEVPFNTEFFWPEQ